MRTCLLVLVFSALAVAPSLAQTTGGGGISDAVRRDWDAAKRNIRESAEQMPADGYAFKPVDGFARFGQLIGHVAGVNYLYCGAAAGDKTERSEDAIEKAATTKDALVKALGESIAYCDKVYASLTDASAVEQVAMPFGGGQGARVGLLLGNATHNNEHYGNLVTYFRIKGMVPPSSKR